MQKARKELRGKCKDIPILKNKKMYNMIKSDIENHDASKLSENEFVQYRRAFYPTNVESEYNMSDAWEHHKKLNPHHWESWTIKNAYWEINCIHMICDWMAMSYKFGDTAKEYYEKNKEKIDIPDYGVKFMYEIFDLLEY